MKRRQRKHVFTPTIESTNPIVATDKCVFCGRKEKTPVHDVGP